MAVLRLVLPKILAVALLPGVIGSVLPRKRWILQVACGLVLGPFAAQIAVIAYEHWFGA
jgi:type IV secretory pathway VirB2 component (pilin)